jgi:hypothetical protein
MKLTRAVLLIALPAGLAAQGQPPAQPSAFALANPMATVFKNRTAGVRRNIIQALDSIPASKYDFKPTPAQLTIGYIAQHVASDSYFFCNNLTDTKKTDPDAQTADSVKAKWPKDTLVSHLRAASAFCDDVFNQLSDAKIGEMMTVGQAPNTRQVPRINYALGHAMDLADHYSQLANYMRLNGLIPPTALPRPGRGGN